jgi:gas vesicle protein
VALVGASVAAGVVVGAGIALLVAPRSGAHTRLALRNQLRRRRPWRHSPWEQLGEELSKAARRRNQRMQAARLARVSEGL